MHHIRVALERNPYDVVIGAGGLSRVGQQMLDVGVQPGRRAGGQHPDVATPYADACLKSLKQAGFSAELLVIDAGEHQKLRPLWPQSTTRPTGTNLNAAL